ncbi:lysozyme inhibitor LprI family protein [Marinimicrococcus flavescens]|uniref:Lysozyme inhibitor LprI-like N-terminal domain-containing protein n=1 Tax=Marinimicrococcus flavescens TaxID=3031815 RepID=A0AAP3UXY4_9PROT|nr:hypothetical protein [Marinimicrococcus flavescens]
MRPAALLLAALLPLASAAALAEDPVTAAFEQAMAACEADPRFRVGGAAMGDCLAEATAALERDLAAEQERVGRRLCPAGRERLALAARSWEEYRAGFCGVVEETGDNTPAFVNAQSCELLVSLRRAADLRFLDTYAAACRVPDVLHWAVEAQGLDSTLRVFAGRRPLATYALGCFMCDEPDDPECAGDGVRRVDLGPVPRPLLLAVCHKGAHSRRLHLLDPLGGAQEPLLSVTGAYALEWRIEGGRLVVEHDGDAPRRLVWPGGGEAR